MFGQQKSFSPEERDRMRSMNMDSLTIVLFRWLKANKDTWNSESYSWKWNSYPIEGIGHYFFADTDNDVAQAYRFKIAEAITNLERKRLVVKVHHGTEKPIICLSSIGLKSNVNDTVLLLVDKPEEIVSTLEQKIGRLDHVIRQYYLESLRAYQEELYISSVICLGAASERAIHWLADALGENVPEYQTGIQRKQKSGSMAGLIQYLSDSVAPNVFDDDKHFEQKFRKRLEGLANLYRENRNEAGHPKTVEQDWLYEDQEILLLHFRRYITTIAEAVAKSETTPTT